MFGAKFDVEIICGQNNKRVHAVGVIQPHLKEIRRGHPDRWAPAQGGEIEDLKLFLVARSGKERQLSSVSDQALEVIEEKIREELECQN